MSFKDRDKYRSSAKLPKLSVPYRTAADEVPKDKVVSSEVIEDMSYKEVQAELVSLDQPATGTAEELTERLEEYTAPAPVKETAKGVKKVTAKKKVAKKVVKKAVSKKKVTKKT